MQSSPNTSPRSSSAPSPAPSPLAKRAPVAPYTLRSDRLERRDAVRIHIHVDPDNALFEASLVASTAAIATIATIATIIRPA